MVTQNAYARYTRETGMRPLKKRFFLAIIRAMKDKKMISGYGFDFFF